MMKQRYMIISVVLFVVLLSLLIWKMSIQEGTSKQDRTTGLERTQPLNKDKPTLVNINLTESQILERIKESHDRRKLVTLDETRLRDGMLRNQMFNLSDVDSVSINNPMPLTKEQKMDGRIFLKSDVYTLEGKRVGDQIEFNVSGFGLKREAIIQKIEIDPKDDIVSWSGYLKGGDQNSDKFHITQTVKDDFTIGTITANGTTYSILMKNGYGWVNDIANEAAAIEAHEAGHGY